MSLDGDIDLLSRIPLFADLAGDHLRLLAFSSPRRELHAGTILFREGEAADCGFALTAGTIVLTTGAGEALKLVETCGRGCLIGELPLFIATQRPATATVTEDGSAIELTRALMTRVLSEYPAVASAIRARLSRRVTATVRDLEGVRRKLLGPDAE